MAVRKRQRQYRGRTLVAIGLVLFVSVALVVVWRRSLGVADAREMRLLERDKRALLSERTTLERTLREASSRSRVVSAAEKRLGLHVATEAQTRSLADSIIPPVDSAAPPDDSAKP
jgi:hypothetical protein